MLSNLFVSITSVMRLAFKGRDRLVKAKSYNKEIIMREKFLKTICLVSLVLLITGVISAGETNLGTYNDWRRAVLSSGYIAGTLVLDGSNSFGKADPPCFDDANRYVDCGNGTVTDTVTGLIWLKNANAYGLLNWVSANEEAAALKHGKKGLTDNSAPGDWRLPTITEWADTIKHAGDLGCTNPHLTDTPGTDCYSGASAENQPFTDVQSDFYWSSSSYATDPSAAWDQSLNLGSAYWDYKNSNTFYAWPVRGGQ